MFASQSKCQQCVLQESPHALALTVRKPDVATAKIEDEAVTLKTFKDLKDAEAKKYSHTSGEKGKHLRWALNHCARFLAFYKAIDKKDPRGNEYRHKYADSFLHLSLSQQALLLQDMLIHLEKTSSNPSRVPNPNGSAGPRIQDKQLEMAQEASFDADHSYHQPPKFSIRSHPLFIAAIGSYTKSCNVSLNSGIRQEAVKADGLTYEQQQAALASPELDTNTPL
eukprot:scaffold139953_cov29-Prasinocladus_malaysianus.AAC.1